MADIDDLVVPEFEGHGGTYCMTRDNNEHRNVKRMVTFRIHKLGKDSMGNRAWRQVVFLDSDPHAIGDKEQRDKAVVAVLKHLTKECHLCQKES